VAHLTPQAHAVFARQHGAASVQQLLDAGMSHRQLRHLQQSGALDLVLRGAYRTPSAPLTELGRCAAVCLARADVAIAGPTAGRLWGFRRLPSDRRIHVLAPRASNPAIAKWVVAYHTDARHEHDVIERDDGIRVTSRARTAFDLARWLTPDDLLSVIEQAAHDGGQSNDDFLEVAAEWLSPQRTLGSGVPPRARPSIAGRSSRVAPRGSCRRRTPARWGSRPRSPTPPPPPRPRPGPIRPRRPRAPVGHRDRSPPHAPRDSRDRLRRRSRPRRRRNQLDHVRITNVALRRPIQRNDRRIASFHAQLRSRAAS
jgi:hypothetical protein